MKKPIANELELTASRFRAVSGPTKHDRATGGSNVASEASNRRETSEIAGKGLF